MPDDEDLLRASDDIAAMICGLPRRVHGTCPTLGLQLERPEHALGPDVRLRKWSTEDRCEFLTLHHEEYLSGDFTGWFSDAALEIDVEVGSLNDETAGTAVASMIDTVKWATAVTMNRGTTFMESPAIIETSGGWRGITLRRGTPLARIQSWSVLQLGVKETEMVARLINDVRGIRMVTSRIDAAVWLYGRSCNAAPTRDALLDAAVGLEMLLVPNAGDSRYRFTLHGLALLDSEPADELESDLKAIYAARSAAAHGGQAGKRFEELAPRARDLLARLIGVVLALHKESVLDLQTSSGDVAAAVEKLIKRRVRG